MDKVNDEKKIIYDKKFFKLDEERNKPIFK